MTDIEIVVFNDKSWVRLTEYQQLKQQIEQMKNCQNCNKYSKEFNTISSICFGCKNKSKWELA